MPEIDSEVEHGMMSLMTSGGRQADQWISFNLGQSTELDKMWIWGFNEINRGSCPAGRCTLRGVSAARIWYSDAVSPTPATNPSTANWTLLGDITIPQGTGFNGFDNVTEVLFHGAQARHVLIDVESTHGLDQGNGDIFVGLSEVQFFSGSGSTDTGRETLDLSAHLQQLVDGENLLAIHGLNESASDHTFLIKPTLSATQVFEPAANLTDALVINEVAPATDATFWLELANVGSEPINVAGVVVTADGVSGGSHTLDSESLPSGGTLHLTEETLGFDAATGDRLFIYSSSQTSLIDAREVTNRLRGRTAEGHWLYPAAPIPGAANEFAFQSDVVINEIMFHHQPSKESDDGVAGEYASTVSVEIDASTPWRYNQSGQNLGSSWAQVAHGIDSVNWFQGPAPLGFESSSLPEAIRTELTNPALNTPFVNTYYFETDFTFSGDLADFVDLQLRHLIDDGAVFYLNGVELTRHNMPGSMGSPVFAGDYASTAINNATFSNATGPHSIVANELVSGTNRLSVEVHQFNLTSSDIVMAIELTARKEITAGFSSPGYLEINEEWFELYNRNAV